MTSEGRPGVVRRNDADLSGAVWVKSRRSSAQANNCVEVARAKGYVAVRDSKDADGPKLTFTAAEWRAFITAVTHGH
jgi:hypothetical protein